MELKNYQRRVLRDLDTYLACLNEPHATLADAFRKFWLEQGAAVGMGAPLGRRDAALPLSILWIKFRVAFSRIACAATGSEVFAARRAAAAMVKPCS